MKLKINDPTRALEYFKEQLDFTTGPVELDHFRQTGGNVNVIDVRTAHDYAEGHVPGSLNLPEEKWNTLEGLKKNELNIIYCYSEVCHLAKRAAVKFAAQGFPVMEMDGGYAAWEDNQLSIERGSPGRTQPADRYYESMSAIPPNLPPEAEQKQNQKRPEPGKKSA